jgi:hypothetical protein
MARIPRMIAAQAGRLAEPLQGSSGTDARCSGWTREQLHFGGQTMPAKSKAQQKAAGAALAAKRGDIPKSELKGASKSMAKSMTEKELDELASTKRKGKPEHVTKH